MLSQSANWKDRYDEKLDKTIFHHEIRPEFTIEITSLSDEELRHRITKPNFWLFYLYNAIGVVIHPEIHFKSLSVKYHTTILYETEVISCDEGNYLTTWFENQTLYEIKYDGGCNKGLVIAYLILDSDKAYVHNFINEKFAMNNKSIRDKESIDEVILFFDNEKEKTDFFNMVNDNRDDFMTRFQPETSPDSAMKDNEDSYDIQMSLRGSEILKEWLKEWKTTKKD